MSPATDLVAVDMIMDWFWCIRN